MIYCVYGETGECSDWTAWPVRSFTDKAKAEHFAAELTAEVDRLCTPVGDEDEYDARCRAEENPPEHDPSFRSYYTGTSYTVVEWPEEHDPPLPPGSHL